MLARAEQHETEDVSSLSFESFNLSIVTFLLNILFDDII